ncbi:alpha/beta fold hydrolase [Leptospira sp. 201903070]|uniref:Alpha/beta fold hydrolase n=1 Tax=Leptospira ainlahdjerensis TaxID=2810033 RepID=A0ABS2UE08_9LEPT|nr:alpha/beta fold hydrolase [Leptospira ainlahdjerensis]MBM9578609.1 alpha/beta fold hydrolase [Leptospira ainlahdjerensis]
MIALSSEKQETFQKTKAISSFQTTFVCNGNLNLFLKYNTTASQRPDRETILFVHGFPDEHSTWDSQLHSLSKEFNVGAFDLRGAGNSSKPEKQKDYNAQVVFQDFEAVIRFMGNGKPVHLVAHDWGAILSWGFVGDLEYSKMILSYTAMGGPHPILARNLMLSYFFSLSPRKIWTSLKQSAKSWYILFFQIPWLPNFLLSKFTMFFWKYLMYAAEIPKKDPMRNFSREEILKSALYPIHLYRELIQGKKFPTPKRISIPVRVFVPLRDMAICPESYDSHANVCDFLESTLVDCNHWIQKEKPDFVSEEIRAFVNRNSSQKNRNRK